MSVKKKILIVDDDPDLLELVKFILASNGFEVHTYATGINVPDIVLDYQPDLILLDIRLPGKLGTEICKDLKQTNCPVPVILFSAHTHEANLVNIFCGEAFIKKTI